jgi:hypothetical protein
MAPDFIARFNKVAAQRDALVAGSLRVDQSMSGRHQNANRADRGGEFDVGPFVADHEGARRIEIEIADCRMHHAGRRLAARAADARRVRASIPGGHLDAFAGQQVDQPSFDGVRLFDRKLSASDAGLIGDDD